MMMMKMKTRAPEFFFSEKIDYLKDKVQTTFVKDRRAMKAAKAALVNFYETLRFELNGDVGITIATHGWIGSEMSRGKFMLEEGAEMQWKEEREVPANGPLEEFAKMIVAGACRGDAYVKFPNWYDVFLLYRVFTPNVLRWTFKLLLSTEGSRKSSLVGVGAGMQAEESSSQMKLMLEGGPPRFPASPPHYTASPSRYPASPPHYTASPPRYPASPPRFGQFNIQELQ